MSRPEENYIKHVASARGKSDKKKRKMMFPDVIRAIAMK
jgi:hypothetical protein